MAKFNEKSFNGQAFGFKAMSYSQIEKYLEENPGTKIEDIM